MKHAKRSGIATIALLLCVSMCAVGCGDEISQTASVATEAPTEAPTEPTTEEPEPELTDRAKKLLAENPDTIGYIQIDGTEVDNPIVQTTDDEYYLTIGFDGEEFRAGTVFMDFRNVFGAYPEEWSENLVIYGHNMADNSMFGSLRRYRQDLEYYKDYPFITLSSNYADYTYVIFGLVITSGDAGADFEYWNMEELDDEDAFNDYIDTVEEKNMIDNKVDVTYGDSIVTLSTCYSDEDNSRFLVIGRMLRDDETEDELLELIQSDDDDDDE